MSPVLITPYGESQPVEVAPGRGDLRTSSIPFVDWDGGGLFGDRPVSYAQIFATQPWVAIAVMRLITWAVRVPLKAYRRTDDEGGRVRLRPPDHPIAAALVGPWERGSMAELTMGLLGPLWVHGNGLTDVHEGAGGRLRFEPLDWRRAAPLRLTPEDPNADIVGWEFRHGAGGVRDTRSADTVMHLRWWSPLGRLGVSPLRQLRSTVTAEAAAVEWTLTNLANAARPSGVVETSEKFLGLEPAERQQVLDQLRLDLREAYGGPRNAGKLPVLPPGLTWSSASQTTAVEAELIDQRKVNREEVAAVYQLPPPMIGILDKATYSNIATAREIAYTDGLAPPLVLAEQAINAHLVQGMLREDDVFVEYDLSAVLRGNPLKEVQALREAIGSALLTPNEGRDILNRPRSDEPEADRLHIPANNLRPLGTEPAGGRR